MVIKMKMNMNHLDGNIPSSIPGGSNSICYGHLKTVVTFWYLQICVGFWPILLRYIEILLTFCNLFWIPGFQAIGKWLRRLQHTQLPANPPQPRWSTNPKLQSEKSKKEKPEVRASSPVQGFEEGRILWCKDPRRATCLCLDSCTSSQQ